MTHLRALKETITEEAINYSIARIETFREEFLGYPTAYLMNTVASLNRIAEELNSPLRIDTDCVAVIRSMRKSLVGTPVDNLLRDESSESQRTIKITAIIRAINIELAKMRAVQEKRAAQNEAPKQAHVNFIKDHPKTTET